MSKPMINQGQSVFKPVVLRPWYGCGGDHWYRYCLDKKEITLGMPPIRKFGIDCGIKHFIQGCTSNQKLKGKDTLNYVEIILLANPSSYE